MALSGFSVGRDCTVNVFDPNVGGIVTIKTITQFEAKPDTVKITSKGMDGIVRHAMEPNGWSGSFMIDRSGANVDRLFAQLEDQYYSGVNILSQTITQTIEESDRSITQYRFTGVALFLDEGGAWTNGKQVTQKISWCASKRATVS